MIITIDTRQDSADDIRRVVKMLQAWLEGHSDSAVAAPFNLFSDDKSQQQSQGFPAGLFNIFGDDNSPNQTSSQTSQGTPSTESQSLSSMQSSASESEEEIPEIREYY
ncbi:MAG: hypothetical protein N3D84_00195 [Candidatus Woesearchaeota archaeon]|nr:hypothetical protein [Candidatus Woesearchaeota archaeon]